MGGYYNNKGKGKGTPKGGKSRWEGYERYDDGKGKGKTRDKGYGKGKDEKGKGPETDYIQILMSIRSLSVKAQHAMGAHLMALILPQNVDGAIGNSTSLPILQI